MKILFFLFLFPLHLFCIQHFPLIIAHRGASAHAPENTLPAFSEAVRRGADAIEVDVRLSRDSMLVIHHDATINRTSDGSGTIAEMTFKELQRLDVGSHFSQDFRNERIPAFRELLRMLDERTLLIVEIKSQEEGIEQRVIDEITRSGKRPQTILKSFYPDAIRTFHRLAPDIRRIYVFALHWPLLNFTFATVPRFENIFEIPAEYLQIHHFAVTRSFIRQAHSQDRKVIVWGVDSKESMKGMIDLGVDGIETDYPDVLHSLK